MATHWLLFMTISGVPLYQVGSSSLDFSLFSFASQGLLSTIFTQAAEQNFLFESFSAENSVHLSYYRYYELLIVYGNNISVFPVDSPNHPAVPLLLARFLSLTLSVFGRKPFSSANLSKLIEPVKKKFRQHSSLFSDLFHELYEKQENFSVFLGNSPESPRCPENSGKTQEFLNEFSKTLGISYYSLYYEESLIYSSLPYYSLHSHDQWNISRYYRSYHFYKRKQWEEERKRENKEKGKNSDENNGNDENIPEEYEKPLEYSIYLHSSLGGSSKSLKAEEILIELEEEKRMMDNGEWMKKELILAESGQREPFVTLGPEECKIPYRLLIIPCKIKQQEKNEKTRKSANSNDSSSSSFTLLCLCGPKPSLSTVSDFLHSPTFPPRFLALKEEFQHNLSNYHKSIENLWNLHIKSLKFQEIRYFSYYLLDSHEKAGKFQEKRISSYFPYYNPQEENHKELSEDLIYFYYFLIGELENNGKSRPVEEKTEDFPVDSLFSPVVFPPSMGKNFQWAQLKIRDHGGIFLCFRAPWGFWFSCVREEKFDLLKEKESLKGWIEKVRILQRK